MFMPRWASRITLEITEVRVERVRSISGRDAIAEGVAIPRLDEDASRETIDDLAVAHFHLLWNSINGKTHPQVENPWVWALTFQRVNP